LAFGLGTGLSPRAPGTAGTLLAVPLWLALAWLPTATYVVVVAAVCAGAIWVCGRSSHMLGVHDHPGIVADEVAGFLVAAAPLLPALGWTTGPLWLWLGAAFVLFRVFDIAKPWPIRRLDAEVHGGLGIVLDDLLAGLYAAVVLGIALAAAALW
jgi:phosphatidylglycerophosphatase A